jgi:molybdate transport system substrate-binding protein
VNARPSRAALAAAAVLLAGCGADPTAAAPEAPEQREFVVLAAASLTEVLTALEDDFERLRPGADLVLSFGASSTLAQQVVAGAPADVFASASPATMKTVVDAGAADGEPQVFARNRLQLAVPPGNPGGVRGLADLAREDLDVALCAAQVPCGAAAEKALAAAGVAASVDTLEQDVKAVLAKVRMGEVDAGLVYVTDVRAAGDGVEGIAFPEAEAAVNDYPVAVLRDAPQPEDARAFVELLQATRGQQALEGAGFEVP